MENSCPEDLKNLAREINALIERMDKQVEHVKDQSITVDQLLTQAKKRCDKSGFKAFREKFFPDLGKSRFYELLQVATDKRSLREIRAITRERVARHRAIKAAASVTVTENAASARGSHGETRLRGVAAAHRDARRVECIGQVKRAIEEIMKIVSDLCFDDQDRRMVRHEHEPYLDGFIDERGARRFEPSRFAAIEPTLVTVGPQGNGDSPDKPANDQRPHPKHDLSAA